MLVPQIKMNQLDGHSTEYSIYGIFETNSFFTLYNYLKQYMNLQKQKPLKCTAICEVRRLDDVYRLESE